MTGGRLIAAVLAVAIAAPSAAGGSDPSDPASPAAPIAGSPCGSATGSGAVDAEGGEPCTATAPAPDGGPDWRLRLPRSPLVDPAGEAGDRNALARRREPRRSLLVPAVESLGVSATLQVFNRYLGKARWARISPDTIWANTHRAWGLDDDQFWINQMGHSYQGGIPYTAARSAGFGFWGSSAFVFASSALWEIAAETERPSVNDQITTVAGGAALGEVMHRLASSLRGNRNRWTNALAAAVDPFSELNRTVLGTPAAELANGSRWWFSGGAIGRTNTDAPSSYPTARFALAYTEGIPGDPELRLARPFDHFVFEGAYVATGDPDATLRMRGLVAGRTFAFSRAQGVWGLFLSLDVDTPGQFRTSTTGVGIGASARSRLPGGVAIEGTALLSGVPLGTAGRVPVPAGLVQRDYVMGPGAQGLLELRAAGWDRVIAGISLRQFFVAGFEARQGDELLLEGRATAFVRVARQQGLGVEVGRNLRYATDPEGARSHAKGALFHAFWAVGGGTSASALR